MPESNATELIKYLTEDNLKLMYGRLNRRYVVVDALPSVDSLEPADKNVIYVVKETVGKTVRYWPNVLDNDAWKPFGIGQADLDGKADKVSNATVGNFAGLDDNGNLTDSGYKASDFKPKQTAVTDPTASGSGIEFIDSISQDTNGVIVPAKKSVQVAVASTSGVGGNAGVMSAADKEKLDGIEAGAQANTIESISINNAPLDITNKNVDIPLATADSDGLLPHEKFPLIPAEPVAGANRIYSFDDTNGTSWQTIVKEYVGNMILDQQGTPVTDEKGDIMYEEEAVPLWLSYKGVEFGARRAYDDHTGTNIHDSIEARTTMAQVTTAIETALAKYGGFVVVDSLVDGHPDVADPSERFIYLYRDPQSSAEDPYTEWIYTASGMWDKIGTTSIDVSNFTHKVANATGNLPKLKSDGDLENSGIAASDVATSVQNSHSHLNKAVLDEIPARSGTDSAMLYSADDSSSITWKNWSYVTVSKKTANSVLIGKTWYPYVKIGNLYWTTENLREPIGTKNTDYWVYDENTVIERGYIYKHETVIKGQSGVESDALLALLHDGWRIPTRSDANNLTGQSGTYWDRHGNDFFATDAARITPDTGVTGFTDKYGFHAYPSGTYRASGYGYSDIGFHNVNSFATFYTKTPYDAAGLVQSFYVSFPNGSSTVGRGESIGGSTGLSCCVRLCKSAT